jgi:serine/threonine protein kinase
MRSDGGTRTQEMITLGSPAVAVDETRGCRPGLLGTDTAASRARVTGPSGQAAMLLAGRYRLIEVVGQGATASVWRARDELLDRDVAVKWFHGTQALPVPEARMTARFRHPHVVAVHDVLWQDGSWVLVMDYYPGGSLASLLSGRSAVPPPVAASIGVQLLAALRAVHEAGVVHCDVKPANLLLGRDGDLALIDFGIAEISGQDPVHPARREGMVVGSPGYLAPELLQGGSPTPASDLWSMGVTLYTAVEGRPPFSEGDPLETVAAVLHDPPPRSRRAGRLRPLLDRLLVREPNWRPSHDEVHALLTDAGPAPRGPILAGSAVDLPPAEPATSTASDHRHRMCA